MKRRIKNIFKNPMLLVFLIIIIFFMPYSIYSPGENRNKGIVTAIGIDKNSEIYEVSLLTIIPTPDPTFKDKTSIITGKGNSIAKAINSAQLAMGRKVGLAHAKTTIVSENMLKEDIMKEIDYLSRVASLPENTVFICCNQTAKKFIETSKNMEKNIGLKLEQVVGFNANNIYVTDTSLESFYKGYYSDLKSSVVGYFSIENNDKNSDSGAKLLDSEEQESKSNETIVNEGQAILLKNGKMVKKLNIDELNGINLLNKNALNQIIKIDNVKFKDSLYNLNYKVKNKSVLTTTEFENNIPVYNIQLKLGLELVEIEGDHNLIKMNTEFSDLNDEIREKLDKNIKRQFTNSIQILKDNKTDIIGVNEQFFKENRKQYKAYIKTIKSVEDFLQTVVFKLNVVIEPD